MKLLNLVVDGSLAEGVTYGSYTARSVTQYVYLAKRHLRTDYSKNTWLHKHYQFYLATVLPGYKETVGIADSSRTWFYGPESQLVFLDSFIMKNGLGNWLASRVRQNRATSGPLGPARAHKWCTLHTEYVFYDPSLGETSPFASKHFGKLVRFSDWGVTTYGAGHPSGTTFVSFKSSALMGRAVHATLVQHTYDWLRGWWNLNPGHEHPDQNSFVFFPRGRPFVTEAFYGPKYTYLNNVLTFGYVVDGAGCPSPHRGQNGECEKWLKWKDNMREERTWAELISANEYENTMFANGEALGAYPSSLHLESVYRAIVLLDDDTLLVFDHVALGPDSKLTTSNAYFHNIHEPFKVVAGAAYLNEGDDRFRVRWISTAGVDAVKATTGSTEYHAEFGTRKTNFLNVSVPLRRSVTRTVYAFVGPSSKFKEMRFLKSVDAGVVIEVVMDAETVTVSVATAHEDPRLRFGLLGFLGYARIDSTSGRHIRFGVDIVSSSSAAASLSLPSARSVLKRDVSVPLHKRAAGKAERLVDEKKSPVVVSGNGRTILLLFVGGALLLLVARSVKRPRRIRRKSLVCVVFLILFAALIAVAVNELSSPQPRSRPETAKDRVKEDKNYVDDDEAHAEAHDEAYDEDEDEEYDEDDYEEEDEDDEDGVEIEEDEEEDGRRRLLAIDSMESPYPRVFVTSFLGFGAELVSGLFENRPDFLSTVFPSSGLQPPAKEVAVDPFVDACEWHPNRQTFPLIAGWFKSFYSNPEVYLDPPKDVVLTAEVKVRLKTLKAHKTKYPNSLVVLTSSSASWNLKLPWLHSVLGSTAKMIYVVRDPRSWISTILDKREDRFRRWKIEERLQALFARQAGRCRGRYAFEYDDLRSLYDDDNDNDDLKTKVGPVKQLALLWKANTAAAIRINQQLPQTNYLLVRFEDLIEKPAATAETIYRFVGGSLPFLSEHWILQSTGTGMFRVGPDRQVDADTTSAWKEKLTLRQIREIESVCESVMTTLGYEAFSLM